MKKLGIIGLGNMGSALLLGILNSSLKNELEISGYDIDEKKINSFKSTINISKSAEELIRNVETLLLAIKPQDVGNFLQNYSDLINTNNSILITIVAGLKIKIYRRYLSRVKIARVMPNTPSLVGYGASAIYFDGDFLEEEKKLIVNIFESCGIVEGSNRKICLMWLQVSLARDLPMFLVLLIHLLMEQFVKAYREI